MDILEHLNKPMFDNLWSQNDDWYETPNLRRGGWSGVVKTTVKTSNGISPVYLKKQYNHTYRSWLHFFKKQPTALREYRNIKRLNTEGIPTVDIAFFAVNGMSAVLGTHALSDYESLDKINLDTLTIKQRRQMIRAVAKTIRKLHMKKFQHGCLYPKHIFVRQDVSGWSVKLIDLEKMKRRCFSSTAMKHDLDTLNRRSEHLFNMHDRLTFLLTYIKSERAHTLLNSIIKKCCS